MQLRPAFSWHHSNVRDRTGRPIHIGTKHGPSNANGDALIGASGPELQEEGQVRQRSTIARIEQSIRIANELVVAAEFVLPLVIHEREFALEMPDTAVRDRMS